MRRDRRTAHPGVHRSDLRLVPQVYSHARPVTTSTARAVDVNAVGGREGDPAPTRTLATREAEALGTSVATSGSRDLTMATPDAADGVPITHVVRHSRAAIS